MVTTNQWQAGMDMTADDLNASVSQVDTTSFTVTSASSPQQCSFLWPIAANDPAGTMYRLLVWGGGTQGSTQQNLGINLGIFGSNIMPTVMTGTEITASTLFHFVYEAWFVLTSAGSSAGYTASGRFTWTTAATVTTSNTGSAAFDATGTVNNTAATTMSLELDWGSTTGAPTITSRGSLFQRIAPIS